CFDVIVDRCCPTNCIDIICPSNIVVACQQTAGQPGAYVTLPQPRVTNHCGAHVLPTGIQVPCRPQGQPGEAVLFPPGTNEVICCVSQDQTILDCCCFEVIVRDCPPSTGSCVPRLVCPPAAQIEVSCQGPNGAIVFFPPPQVSDPCNLVLAT